MKPLAIDLFCGLGGWTDGLLAEGWNVVGFDIERHDYGDGKRYPAQLVLQDVRTIHGRQFKGASLIVASPPCQEYSYMAMPWSRAKAIAHEYRTGKRDTKDLTRLFDECFRIQREASEAAGRRIPMVVENVRGAQPWVGRAKWNFGSFYLWGDVPALMPQVSKRVSLKSEIVAVRYCDCGHTEDDHGLGSDAPCWKCSCINPVYTDSQQRAGDGVKFSQSGAAWFDGTPRDKMLGDKGPAAFASKSNARKAASATIAKIPFALSQHIARVYKSRCEGVVR